MLSSLRALDGDAGAALVLSRSLIVTTLSGGGALRHVRVGVLLAPRVKCEPEILGYLEDFLDLSGSVLFLSLGLSPLLVSDVLLVTNDVFLVPVVGLGSVTRLVISHGILTMDNTGGVILVGSSIELGVTESLVDGLGRNQAK